MDTRSALCLLVLGHVLLAVAAAAGDAGKIGICHGRVGSNLPPPSAAATLLKQNGVTKARLFLPDPAVLPAFAAAGIDLMVGVPNENLTFLAASGPDGAAQWLRSAVLAHAPVAERLRYLAVVNEVLYNNQFYAPHLVPAMGLGGRVKVSSAHASSVLAASYPPSAGTFDAASLPVLRPMLQFLADTGAPFMVNTYPFISYVNDPANVQLAYALFGAGAAPVQDGALVYTNLFDATVDALVAALEKEGFGGVPVAVTETGVAHRGAPGRHPAERRRVQRQDRGEGGARRQHAEAARRARGDVPVRPVRRGRQARPQVRTPLWHLQGGRPQGV